MPLSRDSRLPGGRDCQVVDPGCNMARSVDAVRCANPSTDLDHGITGRNRRRPGLQQALAAVRNGDTVVVPKVDRLAQSAPDA